MPNVFRNSPVDSLTNSVNALRQRQMESQSSQVQMMQINSELESKEAERKLLPKRLELEEERLGYEKKMGEMSMNLEVVKTVQSVLSDQFKNGLLLNEEIFRGKMRPIEAQHALLDLNTAATRYAYLDVNMRTEVVKGLQMNQYLGLEALGRSMVLFSDALGGLSTDLGEAQVKRIASTEVWDEAIFGESRLTGNPKFNFKALDELYGAYADINKEASRKDYIGTMMHRIFNKAAYQGGFFNEDNEFTNPGDPQMEAALDQASAAVLGDQIIDNMNKRLSTDSRYETQLARYNELVKKGSERLRTYVDKNGKTIDERAEKKALKKGLLASVQFSDGKFSYKGYGNVGEGGSVENMLWAAFFSGPAAMASARTYMETTNTVSNNLALQSLIAGIVRDSAGSAPQIMSGNPKGLGAAMQSVEENKAKFNMDTEEFLKQFNENWNGNKNDMINRVIANPEAFGVMDLQGNQKMADYLHPVVEVLPSPKEH